MFKFFSSLYTSFYLLGVSIVFFFLSSSTVLLLFKLGLLLGCLAATSLFFRVLTSKNNSNILILACVSFMSFSFFGFYNSISALGWDSLSAFFSSKGYTYTFDDVKYACIYSNIFIICFCLVESNVKYHRKLIVRHKEIIFLNPSKYRSHFLFYAVLVASLKLYLLISGTLGFSFTGVQDNLQEYGGLSGSIYYLVLGLSGSNTFIVALLLVFKRSKFLYLEILLLIAEILFSISQGRRPLIANTIIFGLVISMALSSKKGFKIPSNSLTSMFRPAWKKYGKIGKIKIFLLLLFSASTLWLLVTLLSYYRYSFLLLNNVEENVFFGLLKYAFGGFLSDLLNGNSILQEANKENQSIRGAFYISYLAHTIHGIILNGQTSNGAILSSSIIQSIPSVIGIINKADNIQGEEIIGNLVNLHIVDGSNNLVVYSFADFLLLGPILYPLLLFLIIAIFLDFVYCLSRKNSLTSVLCISAILYYSLSFSETSWTNLFIAFRSIIIIALGSRFIEFFYAPKSNSKLVR